MECQNSSGAFSHHRLAGFVRLVFCLLCLGGGPAPLPAASFGGGKPVYSTSTPPVPPAIPEKVYQPDSLNAASLAALIARVSKSGGGRINLPAGVCWLDAPVTLRPNVALIGAGAGRTIFKRHADFPVAGSFGGKTTGLLQAHNKALQNVLLKDFTIDGGWTGEELEKLQPNVLGVLITSDVGGPDKARHYNRQIVVDGVEVKNCGLGMHVKGATHLTIRNCHMRDNGPHMLWHNIYLRRVGVVLLENNHIEGSPKGSGLKIVGGTSTVEEESRHLIIRNNFFDANARNNLYVAGFDNVLVDGNTFSRQRSTEHALLAGFYVSDEKGHPSVNLDIINNRFSGNASHGLHLAASSRFHVAGNLSQGNGSENYCIGADNTKPWDCDYNEKF